MRGLACSAARRAAQLRALLPLSSPDRAHCSSITTLAAGDCTSSLPSVSSPGSNLLQCHWLPRSPSLDKFAPLRSSLKCCRLLCSAVKRQQRGRKADASERTDAADDEESDDGDENAAKGPIKTVKIFCNKCQALLYKYRKGGNGALVKCLVERIAEDHTAGDMRCGACGSEFARLRLIKGKPAHKIIGGRVFMRK